MTTWKSTPTKTIDVDGTPFAYRELGEPGGVPVVFLHHLTAVLDDWDPRVLDGVAAERHVIAFDNRGVGATGGRVPTDFEQMGADAIAFIRALGFEHVDLIGFSLGGAVAQMVALQAPDLVRRMVLAGTGPRGGGGIWKMPFIVGAAYMMRHQLVQLRVGVIDDLALGRVGGGAGPDVADGRNLPQQRHASLHQPLPLPQRR